MRQVDIPSADAKTDDLSGFKGYRDLCHRTVSPADTVARLTPLLGRAGITRVANVTGLDRIGIPVVMVCRPNSRSVAVSQGKGLDLDAAKASGIMEAIEGWHAERITLPLVLGSYEDLKQSHPLVDVANLPVIRGGLFHPHLPLLWIEGKDLVQNASAWVPYEMVHTNYTIPRPTGSGSFPASSNGLASGNHYLEATCHAICELIERDATCLWNNAPQAFRAKTRIDPTTLHDPNCRILLDKVHAAGLEIAIWNVTSDIGVAAFFCLLLEDRTQPGHMGAGAGCHPSRDIALLRALTEAVQTRTTYITGSRDDIGAEEFKPTGIRRKYRFAASVLDGDQGDVDFQTVPTREAATFAEDLEWLLKQLQSVGLDQVITVDLSKPDFGVAVVRSVIPGLEHDDADHLPGPRLQAVTAQ